MCRCLCGTEKAVRPDRLESGVSSGCKRRWCFDPSGMTFGAYEVLGVSKKRSPKGLTLWTCRCKCGTVRDIVPGRLTTKKNPIRGCTCTRKRHGKSNTPEYRMWLSAKQRARRQGIPFRIKISDIDIPEFCPILGIALRPARNVDVGSRDKSPSLDRIVPELGYIPGNIRVISNRANRIKSDAAAEELRAIADFASHASWSPDPRFLRGRVQRTQAC